MKRYIPLFEEFVQNDNSTEDKTRRYLERKRREAEERERNKLHPENKGELQDMILDAISKGGPNATLNHIDTSEIEDMSRLFRCYRNNYDSGNNEILMSFNGDISKWDTSSVKDMSYMFNCATKFNQPIGGWDVSSVTKMDGMFMNAHDFNQPIGDWDVSNVTKMDKMFAHANDFNQDLNKWSDKLNKVTDMSNMFAWAINFNQDINNWKMPNVESLAYMFDYASKFNSPLNKWGDWINIRTEDDWLDFSAMFRNSGFKQDISNWQLRKYMDYNQMFYNCPISEDFMAKTRVC